MTACGEHRPYLGAIADGETAAVPTATLDHVRACADCTHEVDLQQAVAGRLRQAAEVPTGEFQPRIARRRVGVAAAALAMAVVLAAAAAFAFDVTRPDPVLAAAQVSQRSAQFTSGDGTQIGAWCVRESGRPMPEMELPPLEPVGARMDREAGAGIVTVYYVSPVGEALTVSWLDASAAPTASRAVSSRMIGGRLVLVARSPHGTAVISGQAPSSLLWATAAKVEDGT